MIPYRRIATALALLLLAWGAHPEGPSEAQRQRLAESLRNLLVGLVSDPAFSGLTPADWDFVLSAEPQRVDNFGIVLNPRFDASVDQAGPLVLAVTPGSSAARLGLRSGDRLQRFNDTPLQGLGKAPDGRAEAYRAVTELLAGLSDGDPVAVEVGRNGRTTMLTGTFREIRIPGFVLRFEGAPTPDSAMQVAPGCGTVSVAEPPPREFGIYSAEFVAINGDQAGAGLRSTHYLVPGEYRFTLREDIPERELADQTRRFADRRPDEVIELRVEPDMVYQLGARLLVPRREQQPDQPFWRPVMWKAEPGECRGKPVER